MKTLYEVILKAPRLLNTIDADIFKINVDTKLIVFFSKRPFGWHEVAAFPIDILQSVIEVSDTK